MTKRPSINVVLVQASKVLFCNSLLPYPLNPFRFVLWFIPDFNSLNFAGNPSNC